jgi:hypothetical protein
VKEYLKRYSDENPERFNKEFIYSRDKTDILEYVKDIFKSLEILGNFRVMPMQSSPYFRKMMRPHSILRKRIRSHRSAILRMRKPRSS